MQRWSAWPRRSAAAEDGGGAGPATGAGDAAADEERELQREVADARGRLRQAALSCARWGWLSFWFQLVTQSLAAAITLLSMSFSSPVRRGGEGLVGWGSGRWGRQRKLGGETVQGRL